MDTLYITLYGEANKDKQHNMIPNKHRMDQYVIISPENMKNNNVKQYLLNYLHQIYHEHGQKIQKFPECLPYEIWLNMYSYYNIVAKITISIYLFAFYGCFN